MGILENTKRVKNALKALREAVPGYFEDRISDRECPSDWDLQESCRHVDKSAEAHNCRECWRLALEDE